MIHKSKTIHTKGSTLIGFINIIMNNSIRIEICHLHSHRLQVQQPYHRVWPISTSLLLILQLSTLPILTVVGWVAAFSLSKRPFHISTNNNLMNVNKQQWQHSNFISFQPQCQIQHQLKINTYSNWTIISKVVINHLVTLKD